MKYLLDTNTCIRFLTGRSPAILRKLQAVPAQDVLVSSIVKAELYYGAAKSTRPQQTLKEQQAFLVQFSSLPFDDAAAEHYARMMPLNSPNV